MVSVSNETNDKLLLVRQPRHPGGMYTCIAGFLDAGEAIEVDIQISYLLVISLDKVLFSCLLGLRSSRGCRGGWFYKI